MKVAQHWPVLCSYDQLSAYARSKGGRLPTELELRLFLDTYDVGHEGGANLGFRNWHPVPYVVFIFFLALELGGLMHLVYQSHNRPERIRRQGIKRRSVGVDIYSFRWTRRIVSDESLHWVRINSCNLGSMEELNRL